MASQSVEDRKTRFAWEPTHVILFGGVGESDQLDLCDNQLTSFSSEGLGNLTKLA